MPVRSPASVALLLAWWFIVAAQGPEMLSTRVGPFPDRATCDRRLEAMLPSLVGPTPKCYEQAAPREPRSR